MTSGFLQNNPHQVYSRQWIRFKLLCETMETLFTSSIHFTRTEHTHAFSDWTGEIAGNATNVQSMDGKVISEYKDHTGCIPSIKEDDVAVNALLQPDSPCNALFHGLPLLSDGQPPRQTTLGRASMPNNRALLRLCGQLRSDRNQSSVGRRGNRETLMAATNPQRRRRSGS